MDVKRLTYIHNALILPQITSPPQKKNNNHEKHTTTT